ncbi:hypothetical protein VTI74DRAFT_5200 [Chaetomium olivicolor]
MPNAAPVPQPLAAGPPQAPSSSQRHFNFPLPFLQHGPGPLLLFLVESKPNKLLLGVIHPVRCFRSDILTSAAEKPNRAILPGQPERPVTYRTTWRSRALLASSDFHADGIFCLDKDVISTAKSVPERCLSADGMPAPSTPPTPPSPLGPAQPSKALD